MPCTSGMHRRQVYNLAHVNFRLHAPANCHPRQDHIWFSHDGQCRTKLRAAFPLSANEIGTGVHDNCPFVPCSADDGFALWTACLHSVVMQHEGRVFQPPKSIISEKYIDHSGLAACRLRRWQPTITGVHAYRPSGLCRRCKSHCASLMKASRQDLRAFGLDLSKGSSRKDRSMAAMHILLGQPAPPHVRQVFKRERRS